MCVCIIHTIRLVFSNHEIGYELEKNSKRSVRQPSAKNLNSNRAATTDTLLYVFVRTCLETCKICKILSFSGSISRFLALSLSLFPSASPFLFRLPSNALFSLTYLSSQSRMIVIDIVVAICAVVFCTLGAHHLSYVHVSGPERDRLRPR